MARKDESALGKVPTPDMRKGIKGFVQDVIREMKKVIWPTKADTIRFTMMVIVVMAAFIIYMYLLGVLIEFLLSIVFGKKDF